MQSKAELLKLWHSASILLGKDTAYLDGIQTHCVYLNDEKTKGFDELVPEMSRSFSSLIRSWRKAREWIQKNLQTDITTAESERFQTDSRRLLLAINRDKSVELMTPAIMEAVRRDLEMYRAGKAEQEQVDFSYLLTASNPDCPDAMPDRRRSDSRSE
ncbi:MAG: hypothetical protein AB4050_08915 [Synechococcus sp.]